MSPAWAQSIPSALLHILPPPRPPPSPRPSPTLHRRRAPRPDKSWKRVRCSSAPSLRAKTCVLSYTLAWRRCKLAW